MTIFVKIIGTLGVALSAFIIYGGTYVPFKSTPRWLDIAMRIMALAFLFIYLHCCWTI